MLTNVDNWRKEVGYSPDVGKQYLAQFEMGKNDNKKMPCGGIRGLARTLECLDRVHL